MLLQWVKVHEKDNFIFKFFCVFLSYFCYFTLRKNWFDKINFNSIYFTSIYQSILTRVSQFPIFIKVRTYFKYWESRFSDTCFASFAISWCQVKKGNIMFAMRCFIVMCYISILKYLCFFLKRWKANPQILLFKKCITFDPLLIEIQYFVLL